MENSQQPVDNFSAADNSSQMSADNGNYQVVKIGDWVVTMLIAGIPFIGLIMLFVWAFRKGENKNKQNWAKANLVWLAIGAVIAVLFYSLIAASFSSMMGVE